MVTYISPNKHSWNVRRVDELNKEINLVEQKLKRTKGFLERFKVRRQLKKLTKQRLQHGEEIIEYEYKLSNNR